MGTTGIYEKNSNPHQRDAAVKALIKPLGYKSNSRNKSEYIDRGIGTMIDGCKALTALIDHSQFGSQLKVHRIQILKCLNCFRILFMEESQ
jgi:hypothetical protein